MKDFLRSCFTKVSCFLAVLFCGLGIEARGQSACAITGADSVCVGATVTDASVCAGGRWSSGAPGIATVDTTSGVVTGVSAGGTSIYYRVLVSGSYATFSRPIYVKAAANAGTIAGASAVCVGGNATLTSTVSGGSWSSSAMGTDSITTAGVMYGVAAGTATITYSFTNGCGTATTTRSVTVEASTYTAAISGSTPTICLPGGHTFTVVGSVPPGVTARWHTSTSGVGSIDSITGVVTPLAICNAISTGTVTLTFTNSCGHTTDTRNYTVYPPNSMGAGPHNFCPGATFHVTNCGIGHWSYSGGGHIATFDTTTGIGTTGSIAGADSVFFTINSPCSGITTTSYRINVGTPTSMSHAASICSGPTNAVQALVSIAYTGGTWSSDSPSIASVNSTGLITGVSSGTATISYHCGLVYVDSAITITQSPVVGDIGPGSGIYFCTGTTDTLTDTSTLGTWSSNHIGIATVSSGGVVTGVTPGTATITYSETIGGCTAYKTNAITIFGAGNPGVISGARSVCIGGTITLSDTFHHSTGTWDCHSTAVAVINTATHVVTGVAAGTAIVSYTLTDPSIGHCPDAVAYDTITVNPPPPPITGIDSFCQQSGTILYNADTGGRWSCSDPTVASIDSLTGIVTSSITGTTPQRAVVIYTVHTACGFAYVKDTITVFPMPVISGATQVCEGFTTVLGTSIAGGTWWSSDSTVAWVDPTGLLTGVSPGVVVLNYDVPTAPSGCGTTITFTVNPTPTIGISSGSAAIAPYPAVMCGNVLNLVAHGASTYSWTFPTYLYYHGTATALGSGLAADVDVVGLTVPTTYTITGTSAAGCIGTTTYSVVLPTCDASFCTPFSGGPIYALSGNIGALSTTTIMAAGNYNVQANTTFLGTVQFAGNVLAIAPAVTITVDPTSELDIDSCHLYCCDVHYMWNGITLASGGGSSGVMSIGHNSLIEDAHTAVKIKNGFIPATGNVFTSDGTVFNKNDTCIDINQFPAAAATPPTPPYIYPFLIRNSVFTSRDLSVIAHTGSGATHAYPMVWPATIGTSSALKAVYAAPAFTPPFNIVSPNGGGLGLRYNYQACNDGSIANMGIRLRNTGDYVDITTGIAPNDPADYSRVVIGEDHYYTDNSAQNLFDTLLEGIYAKNSNFTCYNSAFMYMHPPASTTGYSNMTGDGIGAETPAIAVSGGATTYPKYSIAVTGTPGSNPTTNLFYDNVHGVTCRQYFDINLSNSDISCTPSTLPLLYGAGGYYVLSRRFHDVTMNGNTMTDVRTGISMNTGFGTGGITQFSGNIAINSNTMQCNFGGAGPVSGSGMVMYNGISATNMFLSGTGTGVYYTGSANIDNNTMSYVYNGIQVNGYHYGQPVTSDNNIIGVRDRGGIPTAQQGVAHVNCIGNNIFNNTIQGPGYNIPVATSDTFTAKKITGIFGSNNINANMMCNYSGNINVGYQLLGSGNLTNWLNNEMDKNAYGLAAKGSFGDQGTLIMACNDVWRDSLWWTGTKRTILTMNGFAPRDTLHVSKNTPGSTTYMYDPTNNRNNLPFPMYFYGFGTTGVNNGLDTVTGTASLPSCLMTYSVYPKAIPLATGPFYEAMPQNWIAQNSLWQAIQKDASLADSSAILSQFASIASGSRYAWLSSIEDALMGGDSATAITLMGAGIHTYIDTTKDTATGVMMQDGVDADYIVANYLTLYDVYLKYMDSSMQGSDSAAIVTLANLCPYSNGNVVYQARAFYRIVFEDDTTLFDNSCGDSVAMDTAWRATPAQPGSVNTGQVYRLFPNPNDGSFMLRQLVADATPTHVEITDMIGRSVFKKDVHFANYTAQLQLEGLVSGIYILRITDINQKMSNFKFIVQK